MYVTDIYQYGFIYIRNYSFYIICFSYKLFGNGTRDVIIYNIVKKHLDDFISIHFTLSIVLYK